jgi:hydrogenase-1 operon protein HyaE
MSSQLSALLARAGTPMLDESNSADILESANEPFLLFFCGDPAQRPEALDVAVIFPELLKAFAGRLRGAVVAPGAEKALGAIYKLDVLPALAVVRNSVTVGVIPRIRDWSEYQEKITAFLDPEASPSGRQGPRVTITYSHKGAEA